METVAAIMQELEKMGSEQTRKTFTNHGAPADMFGVKVGDMKTIVKRVKKNHELAIGLYNTGNSDAMYLAGLIGDETKMTKADLNKWAKKSTWHMISEYTVPFVASESPFAWELANEWINSNRENVASAGWATLSAYVSITPDEQLDLSALKKLMAIIKKDIHQQPNRVRYTMNVFLISVGSYVRALTEDAKKVATYIGHVYVEMGKTSCKVPDAVDYMNKTIARNPLGKKKKTARC
jgi:3-methyladenine DNA glycosylase AlkD